MFAIHKMHRPRRKGNGFFRDAMYHTQRFGRGVDSFFRKSGPMLRDISAAVAPLVAPSNPALAAGLAVGGQAAGSYSALRDKLDAAP